MRNTMIVAWALVLIANLVVAQSPPARGGAGDSTTLAELPAVARYAVSAAIGKSRPAYHVKAEGQTLRTRNTGRGIAAEFGPGGVSVLAGSSRIGLRLAAFGFGNDMHPVGTATRAVSENRVEFRREALTEWYVNGPLGLQHGFTVDRRPEGAKGETLTVVLELTGGLRPVVDADGTGLTLVDAAGAALLRYTSLTAYGADEQTLPAQLEAEDGEVRIRVNAFGARYPVVIDPFFESAKLLASDGAANDIFGSSVSVSGDTVVVGAPKDNDKGTWSGSAYVFVKPAAGWASTLTQTAKLLASDGAANDIFGSSVSVSGDTVVVGAPKDNDKGTWSGSAYVFVKPAAGWASTLTQAAKLLAKDGAAGDGFGHSVSVSGDTLVVGANRDAIGNIYNQGSAYVFVKPGGSWASTLTQNAKLLAKDGASGDWFGNSVSVSGDTVVVGSPFDDDKVEDSGSAYVFMKPAGGWAGTLTQTAKLLASDRRGDQLGRSVSISGDTVVAGAPNGRDKGLYSGSAYVFVKPAGGWSSTLNQAAKLLAKDGAKYDSCGSSVSVSGDKVVAGAPGDDDKGSNSGSAYVFVKPSSGWASTLTQTAKLFARDGRISDVFGSSVSISGDAVMVGSPEDDDKGASSGSVYVYRGIVGLSGSGTPKPGGTVTFDLIALSDAGLPCQLASSLGTGPIQIDTRQIDLSADWMFLVSVWNMLPTVFSNYAGKIGANGTAKASLSIPNISGLVGLTIHSAFVTVSPSAPSGIKSISSTASFKIRS